MQCQGRIGIGIAIACDRHYIGRTSHGLQEAMCEFCPPPLAPCTNFDHMEVRHMNATEKRAIRKTLLKKRMLREVARRMGVSNSTVTYWINKRFPAWRGEDERTFYDVGARLIAEQAEEKARRAIPTEGSGALSGGGAGEPD
jgi:hypothetical protein